MRRAFRNTSKIVLAGIQPGEIGSLPISEDGLLSNRESRALARQGYLVEVKVITTDSASSEIKPETKQKKGASE